MFREVPMVGVREARLGPQGARQDRHPCAHSRPVERLPPLVRERPSGQGTAR